MRGSATGVNRNAGFADHASLPVDDEKILDVVSRRVDDLLTFQHLENVKNQRHELLGRIEELKGELKHWRDKLARQLRQHDAELHELQDGLQHEVDRLKVEFQDIKTILGEQLEKAGEYNAHLMNLRDKKDVRMADAADEHFRAAKYVRRRRGSEDEVEERRSESGRGSDGDMRGSWLNAAGGGDDTGDEGPGGALGDGLGEG